MLGRINLRTFTIADALSSVKELEMDLNSEKFSIHDIVEGMNVEAEHWDVTEGDPVMTAKIAIAHLRERPDYYKLLKQYVEAG